MTYKKISKGQFNVQLSHFLFNGLDVLAAQLGINRSECMRLALYNLLKETYTKKEMEIFASRDDVVDEWIIYLQDPGRAKEEISFGERKLQEEKKIRESFFDEEFMNNEIEKKIEPIKKKYSFPYATDFMKKTSMNPQQAAEYFKNYHKKEHEEFLKYQKELDHYFKTDYPKDELELETKLAKLKGLRGPDELREKWHEEEINERIAYYQDIIDHAADYTDNGRMVENAKKILNEYQRLKKDKKKNVKKKA